MEKRQLLKSNCTSWFLMICGVLFFWVMLCNSQLIAKTWVNKEAYSKKNWTVLFSSNVDANSVTRDTVYVLDSQNQKIPYISPQVVDNKIIVSLNNQHMYAEGSYRLVISGEVSSTDNKKLGENQIVPFDILGQKYFKYEGDTLPGALIGKNYRAYLGGTKEDDSCWEIVSDSLPAGLTLNASTGIISGKPTCQNGVYNVIVKKTSGTIEYPPKNFNMSVLPDGFLSLEVTPPVYTPKEQIPSSEAILTYDGGIKKTIEVFWDTPASLNLGSQNFTGFLGGTDYTVASSGNISYLKSVNFKYDYWATFQWRTVTAAVSGAVREVWMDANYSNGASTRKMDLMKDLSDAADGNVFGTNTNSLKAGDQVKFRLFDAYGALLETRTMIVD